MAGLIKRGNVYYAQIYTGQKRQRISLGTKSLQVAKEKIRQIESAQARCDDLPFPTKTPLPEHMSDYIAHMRTYKTKRSLASDIFYLRESLGPICPELVRENVRTYKRPNQLLVNCLEDITTEMVSRFISSQVQDRDLSPKSANRYREVLHTLFNWAINERGIKMPGGMNPVSRVKRYKEKTPTIRSMSHQQIHDQLENLHDYPLLQTAVSVFIYAGLRREELTWLTLKDVDLKGGKYGLIYVRAKTVNREFWEPKTKVNRVVPISRALSGFLDVYTPRIVPGHWYFPSPKGNHWDPDNLSRSLRQMNLKFKLPWTCLDYRHTFGSQLAMKGESLYKISKLMGNSPEICRRHYAGLISEELFDTVEFGEPISGSGLIR